jgi:outer membrane immunogenic protein
MQSKYLSAIALAAGSVALGIQGVGHAVAADLGGYAPPPPAAAYEPIAPTWQGLYFGLNGGYGFADTGGAENDGFIGGGQVGYNWQRDTFVFGLEGDLQAADISGGQDHIWPGAFGRATSDIDWFSTVRARIGYAPGRTLMYLTGGVAWADIDNALLEQRGPTSISYSGSGTETGYTVGGGMEYALSANTTAKFEYLYMDFGDTKLSGVGSDGNAYSRSVDNDAHVVRLGVNFKF